MFIHNILKESLQNFDEKMQFDNLFFDLLSKLHGDL